ncbi:iron-sensing transcription factor Fep1 [Rhizophagus clarus]|uniref:Iron-sensing transcription factor Fep1 n=1 Tax=Rhizophagus clarus TaxID=94130 RepID=A0A8H3QUD7_9GLOM|nr:iron-sensing transcription factor Fep1 [Rhizophagus clarus]
MTQNYFQEYQSQYSTSYQENDIFTCNYTQNDCSREKVYTDSQLLQLLQLNTITRSIEQNQFIMDDYSKIMCADCLTTSAPRWRVRQDGEKVCNACGLYRRKHGCKRPLETMRECNTINIFNQPEICINCGINESSVEGYCNDCGLYAVFNFLNSEDESSLDHLNNNIYQSNPTNLNKENTVNMNQLDYIQDYQINQFTPCQENDITAHNFMQNYENENNKNYAQVELKQLQLNSTSYFIVEDSLNDNNITDDFSCADCLATSAPIWEICQDGRKVCNACDSYRKKHGCKRSLETTRENNTINVFVNPDQPEICVNCGNNESIEGGHCNACRLYAVFDSSDEPNTPDYTSNGIVNQSNPDKANMEQTNYFQEYQNQNSSPYQENYFTNDYKQTHENAYIEPDLKFNTTTNYETNITDDSSKITCADCSTTTSPRWRVRQDGEKVCNACGLYRRKHGSKRPFEMTREYNIRNIFANKSKICVNCESIGEKHCNACRLYATLDFLNSKDEKMRVKNTQSNFIEENSDDTDQINFIQDYQSQCTISYQENDYSHENIFTELQPLQLNKTTYSTGQYLNDNNMKGGFTKIKCADCLTTTAPMWRIRQDGKKVCNACGLHRRKYGCKRPLEIMRECRTRIKRRTILADPESCANCGTNESTNWRIIGGRRHCNACGLCAIINGRPPRGGRSIKK